ncbi:hypothetical protein X777_00958 [Ooceraea biroi]|uniref:Uncharacterized protein n=1 Tax=Ooceraea biroi TaxID=2015173 RepID=A0A026WQ81_OOCBI|nr:hypothetical protein X777_00958 [Ooceraea biroi]
MERETGETGDRTEEFGASRVPVCIHGRHKHSSQAPTGPDRCHVCNFRERRLSRVPRCSVHARDNDPLPLHSLSLFLSLYHVMSHFEKHLVARMLELQLHEIGETVSETRRTPSPTNVSICA